MENRHWRDQKEVGNPWLMGFITWVALRLGRTPARFLLVFIAAYFFIVGAKARASSRDYLTRVLGRKPSLVEIYRHFHYFSSVTLDRLFLLAGRYNLFDIEIEGKEIFEELKEKNQGCLLFVSHVGSFDIMRVLGARHGALPISILMDQNHNAMVMNIISRLDPELAANVINTNQPTQSLVIQMNKVVSEGGMVGIMVDRLHKGEEGVQCKMLGGEVELPIGPWQIAQVLKVPVVICFSAYLGMNRYTINFEVIRENATVTRKMRKAFIAKQVQSYCDRLEKYIRQHPFNWFNFYQFWKNH